ncbi:MAG: fatty acid desaturase [Pseudomonadales bacterium]|nr:fatty acid desaturase [Pseudomonadales bacterium]
MTESNPLSREELARVTRKSDLRGLWCVASQWAITIGIFVGMALWTNPLSIAVGMVLLGGRQLGFFVLTHEAGHRTLFKTQWLNDFVGTWLTSPVDFSNGRSYMREHLLHHRAAGTKDDPDLANYQDYPIPMARLKRKLWRDFSGRTGWRNISAKYKAIGQMQTLSVEDRAALLRGIFVNVLMFGAMLLFGVPWLYLVWLGAQIFLYPAIIRIRQIAEHAAVPDLASSDARMNTRTTLANPMVRLVLCPHQVNYHVEHHLCASIPIYRLSETHDILRAKGFFDDVAITKGYGRLLSDVVYG